MSSSESASQLSRAQRAEERRKKMAEMDAAISSMGIGVTRRPGGNGNGNTGAGAGHFSSSGPTPVNAVENARQFLWEDDSAMLPPPPPNAASMLGAQDIAHQSAAMPPPPDLIVPVSDGSGPPKTRPRPRLSQGSSGGGRAGRRRSRRSSSFGSANSIDSFDRAAASEDEAMNDSRGSLASSRSQSQSNRVISALEETMAQFDPSWAAKQQKIKQVEAQQAAQQQDSSFRAYQPSGGSASASSMPGYSANVYGSADASGGDGASMPVPLYDFDDVYNELKSSGHPTNRAGGFLSTITNALGNLSREISDSFRLSSSRKNNDASDDDLHFDINIAPKPRRGSESSCGSNPMGYSETLQRLTSPTNGPRRGRKPQKLKAFSYGVGGDYGDEEDDSRFWCCREVGYTLSRHKFALLVGFAIVMAGLAIATMVAAFGDSSRARGGGVATSVTQSGGISNDKSAPTPELLDIDELPAGGTYDGISVIHPAVPDDPAQAKRMGLIYQRIVQSDLSYPSDLDNDLSPQYKALRWISLVDEAQLHHEHHGLLQRYSLAVLFFSTYLDVTYAEDAQNLAPLSVQGVGWKDRTNWMTKNGHCAWKGVQCHQQNGAITSTVFNGNAGVTALNLTSNNLQGTLPREIQGLGDLRILDLGDNLLEGSLPSELGHLSDLEILAIDGNGIDGTLPKSLGRLTKAREIHLNNNYIAGAIPPSLSELTNLMSLSLYRKDLSGTIPHLTGLVNLRALHLDSNYLSGQIPQSIPDLHNLVSLGLGDNELTGTLPLRLCKLKSLKSLRAEENLLEGEVMDCIGKMTSLTELHLYRNRFHGTVPESIGDLISLELLYLDSNEMTGVVPSSIGKLANLRSFYAQNNQLTGPIPRELSSLNRLQRLYLNGNDLKGEVPPELGALTRLEKLRLHENNLSGKLPLPICMLEDHSLVDLQSDCGASSKIECECCTACH